MKKTSNRKTGGRIVVNVDGFKCNVKEHAKCHATGGALYGLGFIGALVYYITTATSVTAGIIGILKAIFWPAFLVYSMMKQLGM